MYVEVRKRRDSGFRFARSSLARRHGLCPHVALRRTLAKSCGLDLITSVEFISGLADAGFE